MKNSKVGKLFFHLMVWLILFSLPYLLSSGQEQILKNVFVHSWIPLILYAIIFYVNYLILITRFLFENKTFVFIIVNALLIIVSIWLRSEINSVFFEEVFREPKDGKGPPMKLFYYVQIISLLVPVVFSIALKTTERWIKTEAEQKEAANIRLQSELQHLRYQLQPHFFFNSLNNIYSMVDLSPEQAKTSIHSLSKLMRYLLYETNTELVSLSDEIDFMVKYIELMKLRVSKNTTINYNFPKVNSSIKIAPLLFISLIENAFKHGVSASKKSEINLKMNVQDKTIIFKTENYNFPKEQNDKSGSGIGLQNLIKRLQLLYFNNHTYNTCLKDDIFTVTLSVNI